MNEKLSFVHFDGTVMITNNAALISWLGDDRESTAKGT